MGNMSSEIRWWSEDDKVFRKFYSELSPEGEGRDEGGRTDHYLRTGLTATGVKIRGGNYEIKLKTADDEAISIGTVEGYSKYSSPGDDHLLTLVERNASEWIPVEKRRYKKTYILENRNLTYVEELVPEGCGIEFTEVLLPDKNVRLFTVGFEAFSNAGRERNILEEVLRHPAISLSGMSQYPSYGYTELLKRLIASQPL